MRRLKLPCNGCGYISSNDTHIYDCYCRKIDDKIIMFGCCDDYRDGEIVRNYYRKPRKLNRYERKMKYKRKLKRITENPSGYPSGAYYVVDENLCDEWDPLYQDYDTWAKENSKYIKRYYRANHAPGYSGLLKKRASRLFRRYRGELANGCAYKKIYDYWWELC